MSDRILELKCKTMNETKGTAHLHDGYYCPKCHGKCIVFFIKGDDIVSRFCECRVIRRNLKMIAESGLESAIKNKTFDTFKVTENWQKAILEKARSFIDDTYYKTFFMGGQPGSGKTHLCTAMCGEFIKRGKETKYFLWTREVRDLKGFADWRYEEKMRELRQVEVLYIDDYLKVMKGATPSPADMAIAFEIINSRLIDPHKVTVISSEFTIEELLTLDEGTASRICESTGPYAISISPATEKNYRLKKR